MRKAPIDFCCYAAFTAAYTHSACEWIERWLEKEPFR
jgi:hypothetical protein